MRPGRIDQVVHILAYNDAIGSHVLEVRDILRRAGFDSEIYAGEVHPELQDQARPVEELPVPRAGQGSRGGQGVQRSQGGGSRGGSWLLFHHSIGTRVADVVLKRPEPLVVDYHNITPPALVDGWAPRVRDELELGLEQLHRLASKAFFGMAHSSFSERELARAGCTRTTVVPALFRASSRGETADPVALRALRAAKSEGGADWLFVGRLSPHKAQHDLVKAISASRRLYDQGARLHLVGTSLGVDYVRALERFATRLGIAEAIRIAGQVPDGVLAAYYETADVFVCLSDHEGFCVPVVEAMERGLPVVAYDAAATGETVGTGGIVLDDKSPVVVAAAVERVTKDRLLRHRLAGAARRRATELSMPASAERVRGGVEQAVTVAGELGIG
jgi:L-malate glycosyltransferase